MPACADRCVSPCWTGLIGSERGCRDLACVLKLTCQYLLTYTSCGAWEILLVWAWEYGGYTDAASASFPARSCWALDRRMNNHVLGMSDAGHTAGCICLVESV